MEAEVPDSPDSPAQDEAGEPAISLGQSFRQSRLEMWFMLGAWVIFFAVVTWICGALAFKPVVNEEGLIPGSTLWGMPRWVVIGIAIPWLAANAFIIWFALGFMKDTPLVDEPAEATSNLSDQ